MVTLSFSPAHCDEVADIRTAFSLFQKALSTKTPMQALTLLSSDTKEYYNLLGRVAKISTSRELEKLAPLNQIMVETVRNSLPRSLLSKLKNNDLISFAISKASGTMSLVEGVSLGEISVDGQTAVADILKNGAPLPIKIAFQKEAGSWRINLLSLIEQSSQLTDQIMNKLKLSSEQLKLLLVGFKSKGVAEKK